MKQSKIITHSEMNNLLDKLLQSIKANSGLID